MPTIELTLEDNMTLMSRYQDNHFDLAVVDPPYGIGEDWRKSKNSPFYNHKSTYKNNLTPGELYFEELFRVSKNQIIWGGNYFNLPLTNSWICWDKQRHVEKTFMSEGELAWTSFKTPFRFFRHIWDGGKKGVESGKKRIHPHQKPLNLYRWILKKYANSGDKILDTHLGSGSIALACHELGFDLTACEIDEKYFADASERLRIYKLQKKLI